MRGRLGATRSSTSVPSLLASSPQRRFISRFCCRPSSLKARISSLKAWVSQLRFGTHLGVVQFVEFDADAGNEFAQHLVQMIHSFGYGHLVVPL